nr:MAG TPA: Pulmonary surfactant-associated protein D, c-type lectin, alpha-helical coiled [Caudoviricetes sp.]
MAKVKTMTAVNLAEARVVTPTYDPTEWETGDVITADLLNHMENGVSQATDGVKALENATAEATALSSGQQPTVSFDGSKFVFGIPAGAQGPKGDDGADGADGAPGSPGPSATITSMTVTVDNTTSDAPECQVTPGGTEQARTFALSFTGLKGAKGDQGNAGTNGQNGSSFRVSATALTDNQAGIAADALTPNNATIAYKVGDIVLDATTKKLYSITSVSGGTATIGTAIATLP